MLDIINRGRANCSAEVIIEETADGRLHVHCPKCPLEWYTNKESK